MARKLTPLERWRAEQGKERDPEVLVAALALLDKMCAELELPIEHSIAGIAKLRAQAIRTFNRAALRIFAEEVLIGQMLLKDEDMGGRALRELLGAADERTAKKTAAACRKLAQSTTVEQLQQAERLLTQFNERLTRKALVALVSGMWDKEGVK